MKKQFLVFCTVYIALLAHTLNACRVTFVAPCDHDIIVIDDQGRAVTIRSKRKGTVGQESRGTFFVYIENKRTKVGNDYTLTLEVQEKRCATPAELQQNKKTNTLVYEELIKRANIPLQEQEQDDGRFVVQRVVKKK